MRIFDKADILLPEGIDMHKWSVVACDQYTAQPEYWKQVEVNCRKAARETALGYPLHSGAFCSLNSNSS